MERAKCQYCGEMYFKGIGYAPHRCLKSVVVNRAKAVLKPGKRDSKKQTDDMIDALGVSDVSVCESCGCKNPMVVDSRKKSGTIMRRRSCKCGNRWTSYEIKREDIAGILEKLKEINEVRGKYNEYYDKYNDLVKAITGVVEDANGRE